MALSKYSAHHLKWSLVNNEERETYYDNNRSIIIDNENIFDKGGFIIFHSVKSFLLCAKCNIAPRADTSTFSRYGFLNHHLHCDKTKQQLIDRRKGINTKRMKKIYCENYHYKNYSFAEAANTKLYQVYRESNHYKNYFNHYRKSLFEEAGNWISLGEGDWQIV